MSIKKTTILLICLLLSGSLACATLRAPSTPAPTPRDHIITPRPAPTLTPYLSPTPSPNSTFTATPSPLPSRTLTPTQTPSQTPSVTEKNPSE